MPARQRNEPLNDPAELERLRAAWAVASAHAVPTEACPEPERLWLGARRELAPRDTRDLLSHTATCPVCAESWDMAARAAAANGLPARQAARPPWVRRLAPWASAAAVLVAVVGFGVWQQSGPATDRSVLRSADSAVIVSLLPEDEPLSRADPVLRWSYPGEGVVFDLRVSWLAPESRRTLAEVEEISRPEYRLPAGPLSEVPPGAILYCEVEARRDGVTLAHRTLRLPIE